MGFANHMMKKAPVPAATIASPIIILHLFLAQNACCLTLLAYITQNLHSFLSIQLSYPISVFSSPASLLSPPSAALSRYFRSSSLEDYRVAWSVIISCLGLCCCWRRSRLGINYELLFEDLCKGGTHIHSSSGGEFLRGKFLSEFLLDFF